MNNLITANELKNKGISVINKVISDETEVLVTVKGKTEYAILPIKTYNHLRECELEVALLESRNNIKNGKYIEESVEKHIKKIIRV
ncbi:MAG: type II toxin-antitoxin system prevent-host-death family antitoxin [Candidatus Firestonebacteria bacterium]